MDIESTFRACMGYARRVCPKDPAVDAEDVLQMAYLRAMPHLAALPDEEARRKYFNVAIRSVAIDEQRRMGRRPVTVQLHDNRPGGNAEDEALARVELAAVLRRVPPALLLHVCGWAMAEIAPTLGENLHTLAVRTNRWRQAHRQAQEMQA
jgi:DNA-directed RNA polymerase specialized sigma24 family protein